MSDRAIHKLRINARRKGYDAGVAEAEVNDPAIIDSLEPRPDPLSGEWAGESMLEIFGHQPSEDEQDAYEDGYRDGWQEAAMAMVAAREEGTV